METFALKQAFQNLRILQNAKTLKGQDPEKILATLRTAQNNRLLLAHSLLNSDNLPVAVSVLQGREDREESDQRISFHESAETASRCCTIS
jgi:hypothetical protein